ncbi:MAG: type II toxin-antitoxin system RelE/ParE family toxin [bacterium]
MRPYEIQLSLKARKQLKKLNPQVRNVIIPEIQKLAKERFPNQFKHLTKHKTADYRLRVGDYRVLYDVYDGDGVVLILAVGHRQDIYR